MISHNAGLYPEEGFALGAGIANATRYSQRRTYPSSRLSVDCLQHRPGVLQRRLRINKHASNSALNQLTALQMARHV